MVPCCLFDVFSLVCFEFGCQSVPVQMIVWNESAPKCYVLSET